MEKQQITITVPRVNLHNAWRFAQKWLLPNPGTLVLMLVLLLTVPTLAGTLQGINATSISTIPYQGRLADASGNPVTGKQNIEFRIYDVPADGTPLWEEFWTGANSVDVSDGLFSVMLGSINTGLTTVVQGNSSLYLGITVGTDSEMVPRVQLGSVPFSIWSLTVADNSITSAKIADDAVGSSEIADGAVTGEKISDELITYQMAQQIPVSVSGARPNYYFQIDNAVFPTPFLHRTLTVVTWLNVPGSHLGIPIAQPWNWNNTGFAVNSRFYCDCDITTAILSYTATGY